MYVRTYLHKYVPYIRMYVRTDGRTDGHLRPASDNLTTASLYITKTAYDNNNLTSMNGHGVTLEFAHFGRWIGRDPAPLLK